MPIPKLAEQVGLLLLTQQRQLVTAESCTGGLLSAYLTDVAGSSAWFERGLITYSNQAKMDLLAVKTETLASYGAVSAETASEMVIGALAHSSAYYAIAITGIAGPTGGTVLKPVGTVYIAWVKAQSSPLVRHYLFEGNRQAVREQTVLTAFTVCLEQWRHNNGTLSY